MCEQISGHPEPFRQLGRGSVADAQQVDDCQTGRISEGSMNFRTSLNPPITNNELPWLDVWESILGLPVGVICSVLSDEGHSAG